MEKPEQNQSGNMNCGVDHGSLPGCCASLAFPFVPMQEPNPVRYSRMEALQTGTLFSAPLLTIYGIRCLNYTTFLSFVKGVCEKIDNKFL
jgi:hypothetical protein